MEATRPLSPFSKARADAAERRWSRLAGHSESMRYLEAAIHRVAQFDCPVLITGETGCGKEEVARAIHAASPRRDQPFVAVNCGGLVSSLAESQLFGHEKGAFTGAFGPSRGVFRAAHGGVVFLDEIGELTVDLQPKLLRVLQRNEVTPVGSTDVHPVDIQVLAATNRDLEAAVDAGKFREDLLYRLNTIHLAVPPLRARAEEIPRFVEHFSGFFARQYGRPVWQPDAGIVERFMRYRWPGNIRQLAQTIQRIYVFEDRVGAVLAEIFDDVTAPADVTAIPGSEPEENPSPPVADLLATLSGAAAASAVQPWFGGTAEVAVAERSVPVLNLAELRRLAVRQALAATGGHRGKAAALLGVSLNTMTRLVEEACPALASNRGRKRTAKPR